MKTSIAFDNDIAKAVGVQEAMLYSWLHEVLTLTRLQGMQEHYVENDWWYKVAPIVEETFFPFWSHTEISRFLANLVSKKYLKLRPVENDISVYVALTEEIVTAGTTKKKNAVTTLVVEDDMSVPFKYIRTMEDGMMREIETTKNKLISEMMGMFKDINSTYATFFGRRTYRTALTNMINIALKTPEVYSLDTLFKALTIVPRTNVMPYAPIINNPSDFERKISMLIAFVQRQNNERKSKELIFKF